MLFVGHLALLWSGNRMALVLSHQPRNTHLEALESEAASSEKDFIGKVKSARVFERENFIDREAEQEVFADFLKFQDDSRLLTIRDKGGMGKSSLLNQFRYICRYLHDPPIPATLVSLDQLSDNTPFTLIQEIRRELTSFTDMVGLELRFPKFDGLNIARIDNDFTPFRTRIDHNAGSKDATFGGANVSIVSPTEGWNSHKEDYARRECVKGFFEDLKQICSTQPVTVLLDSWERSDSYLQEWIGNRIVRPLCFDLENRPETFGLVLAGREVPDFKIWLGYEATYSSLVKSIESLGLWDERHVKEFLQAHGYKDLSEDEPTVDLFYSKLKTGWSLNQSLRLAEDLSKS